MSSQDIWIQCVLALIFNQVRPGLLKFCCHKVSVCVCPPMKLVITDHVKHSCINQLKKCHDFLAVYMAPAIDVMIKYTCLPGKLIPFNKSINFIYHIRYSWKYWQ